MSKTFHFKSFSVVLGDMRCDVNLDRFSRQYQDAQFWLDTTLFAYMEHNMPFLTGLFIKRSKAESAALAGTGKVVAGVGPMGRMLHEGKVMVNSQTGNGPMNIPGVGPRFPLGAKLVPTSRSLTYSNGRGDHWVDKTLRDHKDELVAGVKKRAGGG